MAEFKVIETQEGFDKAIKDRLDRKEKEVAEKFKDFMAPEKVSVMKAEYEKRLGEAQKTVQDATAKLSEHDKVVSELTQRAMDAEGKLMKNRIAHEKGIPLELASRLIGNTEEELTKDAEAMAGFFAPTQAPPLRSNVPSMQSGLNSSNASLDAAYAALAASFNPTN